MSGAARIVIESPTSTTLCGAAVEPAMVDVATPPPPIPELVVVVSEVAVDGLGELGRVEPEGKDAGVSAGATVVLVTRRVGVVPELLKRTPRTTAVATTTTATAPTMALNRRSRDFLGPTEGGVAGALRRGGSTVKAVTSPATSIQLTPFQNSALARAPVPVPADLACRRGQSLIVARAGDLSHRPAPVGARARVADR